MARVFNQQVKYKYTWSPVRQPSGASPVLEQRPPASVPFGELLQAIPELFSSRTSLAFPVGIPKVTNNILIYNYLREFPVNVFGSQQIVIALRFSLALRLHSDLYAASSLANPNRIEWPHFSYC